MKNNLLPFIAFFLFSIFANSSFSADGPCWDVGADYYYSNSASAAAACQLAADASQYTAYCTIWNLYPPTDPSGFYICQGASSSNYANWYWGDYPQFDWEDPVTGELKVSNEGTCILPDVYNPSNNLCEGSVEGTCSVNEYYKATTNQCLTIPVCPDNYSFDTTLEECYLNTIDVNTPVGAEKVFYRTYPDWVDGPYVVDPAGGVWEVTNQISYGDQIGDIIVVKVTKTDLTDIPEGEYDWRMDYDDIDPATGDPYINPNTASPEEFTYEQFSLTNTYTSGPLFTETTKTSTVNGELETVETEVSTSTNSDTGTVTETTTTTTTNLGGGSSSTTTTTETLQGGSAVVTQTSSSAQTGTESDDLPDSTISGGNTCGNPPICSGDVLLCGLIQQTFKTRCNIVQEIPDGDDGGLAALQDGVTADLDSFGEGIISSFGETDALSDFNAAPSDLVAEFNNLFPVSACQDFTFSWKSSAFTLTCEKTALLRLIMAWAAGIYTLFALYTIAFQRTPDKV